MNEKDISMSICVVGIENEKDIPVYVVGIMDENNHQGDGRCGGDERVRCRLEFCQHYGLTAFYL